jgi:hypothetical protein
LAVAKPKAVGGAGEKEGAELAEDEQLFAAFQKLADAMSDEFAEQVS